MILIKISDGIPNHGVDYFVDRDGNRHPVSPYNFQLPLIAIGDALYAQAKEIKEDSK